MRMHEKRKFLSFVFLEGDFGEVYNGMAYA